MPRPFQRLRIFISAPRLLPHIGLMMAARNREIIRSDIQYWADVLHFEELDKHEGLVTFFLYLMTFNPEFRNLFYLRTGRAAWPFRWMCPPLNSLKIEVPQIGSRLFIQHGDNTFISALSIGDDCWIGRHVVIGYSNVTDCPTIGNNVRIFPGAKIVGKIHVGDNATIGLNTVVIDDVPPDVTLLGVPGRIVSPSFRLIAKNKDNERPAAAGVQPSSIQTISRQTAAAS